ncbi:7119_t:CDS:2, partial [Dentiscutata erythropus]
ISSMINVREVSHRMPSLDHFEKGKIGELKYLLKLHDAGRYGDLSFVVQVKFWANPHNSSQFNEFKQFIIGFEREPVNTIGFFVFTVEDVYEKNEDYQAKRVFDIKNIYPIMKEYDFEIYDVNKDDALVGDIGLDYVGEFMGINFSIRDESENGGSLIITEHEMIKLKRRYVHNNYVGFVIMNEDDLKYELQPDKGNIIYATWNSFSSFLKDRVINKLTEENNNLRYKEDKDTEMN